MNFCVGGDHKLWIKLPLPSVKVAILNPDHSYVCTSEVLLNFLIVASLLNEKTSATTVGTLITRPSISALKSNSKIG